MSVREGVPDRFEVVNGPEDGTEFPIMRTPVDIGSDAGCGIFLRLDPEVRHVHARVTVVAEGYRIRRVGNNGVWVNGRRAGIMRSRIARNGDVVRIGGTDLCFVAAPEGLASRSYGLPHESDLGWALRLFSGGFARLIPGLFRFVQESFGGTLKMLIPLAALLFLLDYFWPGILAEAKDFAWRVWYTVRHTVTVITGY